MVSLSSKAIQINGNGQRFKGLEMKLLAIGDNCIDNYSELKRRFPGGNALNVAVYAHRVPGIEADYIGVMGTDEAGDFMLDQMRREGLSTEGVIRLPGESAVTTILIRGGDRVFANYIEGVQKDAVFPNELLPRVRGYDLVHYSVWGFGREHTPSIKRGGHPLLSCDFSNQLEHKALEVMPWLDFSFFSGKELITRGLDPEEKLKELKARTPGLVIMTLGEHGSLVYDGEKVHKGKANPVEVVDTLGAGDSYIAAFLTSTLKNTPIPEAIREGHRVATETCKRLGGWGGNQPQV
jgi:fructoselysine 6-kinase